jgi:hypothetical protein
LIRNDAEHLGGKTDGDTPAIVSVGTPLGEVILGLAEAGNEKTKNLGALDQNVLGPLAERPNRISAFLKLSLEEVVGKLNAVGQLAWVIEMKDASEPDGL